MLQYVGNSSSIADTHRCSFNYPCHLKHAYLHIHKIVFCLYIQNNNFLTNKNVGCPAAHYTATNSQILCDSYFIDILAIMTDIAIDSS